ncbi:NUDIX domain-containing protein [Streptomyces sp. NPDC008001]|uniref:NUDIX domain-containing protein n=1 Tax=Streptomyces sp. NPDC008001 TaxID=3364804 RepID=UPI0036EC5318
MADGVRAAALDRAGRALPLEDGRRAEPDEEPLTAARRELEKETGWRAASGSAAAPRRLRQPRGSRLRNNFRNWPKHHPKSRRMPFSRVRSGRARRAAGSARGPSPKPASAIASRRTKCAGLGFCTVWPYRLLNHERRGLDGPPHPHR